MDDNAEDIACEPVILPGPHDLDASTLSVGQARLLALVAALMWSTSGFFAKAPYFAGWSGPALAFWRAVFACLILWPLVRRPRWSWRLVPMTLFFAGMNYTYLTAMVTGSAANAIWLQCTAPVWVLLVGVFVFHEHAIARVGGAVRVRGETLRFATLQQRSTHECTRPWEPERVQERMHVETELAFGQEAVEYTHTPLSHTDGDAFVFFPGANVLHAGDLLFVGRYPVVDFSAGGSLAGMATALERMEKAGDANTRIIPGHGPATVTRAQVRQTRETWLTINQRLEQLAQQGRSVEEAIAAAPTKDFDMAFNTADPSGFLRQAYGGVLARRNSR